MSKLRGTDLLTVTRTQLSSHRAENARLQARDNCEDGQGWLSADVECRRDGFSGPTCHKHTYESLIGYKALAERLQGEVDSLRTALNQDGHVLEFREEGWAIEHPVECRDGSLLDCRFNFLCEGMGGPPEEGVGRYKAAIDEDGNLVLDAIATTPEEAREKEGR